MIIDELIPDNSERRILQLQRERDAYRRAVQALQHCGSLTDVRQIAAAVLERMADYSRCCDHGKLPDEYCEVCDPPHTNREVQPELVELRPKLDQAEADAAALRRVLGKHEQTIAGYGRASESHLPEVRAALSGEAGQDLRSVADAAARLVQQAPHLPAVAVYHSNVWQELVEKVQAWRTGKEST